MPVRQRLIPAAGSGSCPGPFTNATPKELLPVIERVVETMHLAGIAVGVARAEDVTRHGIILPDGDRITGMVEKSQLNTAPENLRSHVFKPGIFDALARTKPGHKGECQLIDAIRLEREKGGDVRYRVIDAGTPRDLMQANKRYLRKNGHMGPDPAVITGRGETFE